MKNLRLVLRVITMLWLPLGCVALAKGQTPDSKNERVSSARADDSVAVATSLEHLLRICRSVDFSDPKTTSLGLFYKAAPLIVYRGSDKSRRWKSPADYSKEEDKKGVDEVCTRINGTVNQDSSYSIIAYRTEKESEGVWHALTVSYQKRGVRKQLTFAFLKIGAVFLLGDIDAH